MCWNYFPATDISPSGWTYTASVLSNDSTFVRPDGIEPYYYFNAMTVTVLLNGTYQIQSNSAMDTYAIVYKHTFDELFPNRNVITRAYNNNGTGEIRFQIDMLSTVTYILVITTFKKNETGDFLITMNGPASLHFTSFKPVAGK